MTTSHQPATGKTRRRVWIMAGTLLLAGAAAGAAYMVNSMAQTRAATPVPPVFVPLSPFTVNLADADGERYLHVGLSLQVSDEASRQQLLEDMPAMRSRVLLLLSSKRVSDLDTTDGKRRLAREILALANQPFTAGQSSAHVKDALFTDFVIQ